MREIDAGLRAHLEEDATTTCYCWRLSRRDGTVLGFTDHDHDLAFDGTTFLAASGFAASDWESVASLAAPSGDVSGALSSDVMTDSDIAAGRYDGAKVEQFLVNWADAGQRVRLKVLEVGEITRSGNDFRAEMRSVAHRLGQTRGRIYSRRCDAAFGDARCGRNAADFTTAGTVTTVTDSSRITAGGLGSFASGHFRYGLLTFTSGINAGVSADIESHTKDDGAVTLIFWLPLPATPGIGDAFSIVAGCDKSFDTCRRKFDNVANFRGFPHMPGQDFTYSYADGDSEHDGGPLYE